jgi:hypothetical protein
MNKIVLLFCVLILRSVVWAIPDNINRLEPVKETGYPNSFSTRSSNNSTITSRLGSILMIPDWNTDAVGKFDPYDGTFISNFLQMPSAGSPKNAIQGPDNKIYVSDQVLDAVYMFDTLGNYLGIYADASDGLDNIRGIAFRGDHLFICCYHTTAANRAVKEFSGPHTFVRNFISYTGIDPFDIHFLADGRSLFADAGTSDKIALHDTNGVFLSTVYGRSGLWPQQVQSDQVLPGAFLAALWDADTIIDFELNGTIVATCTLTYVKGVYRLGNGNLLATCNRGMFEINTTTGAMTQLNSGTGWQYIELYSRLTGISEIRNNNLPRLQHIDAYPNPFHSRTAIRYTLTTNENVLATIYDVSGKLIRTLIDQYQPQGNYSVVWDSKDNRGKKVRNGIYIITLTAGKESYHFKVTNSH